MRLRRLVRIALPALLLPFGAGCIVDFFSDDAAPTTEPAPADVPVSATAADAWPNAPDVPSMALEDIVRACAAYASCGSAPSSTMAEKLLAVDVCNGSIAFSAERAIPLSNLFIANERAEFFVACALKNQTDCAALSTCMTGRDASIRCEEDGCTATESFEVTCEGTTATLRGTSKLVVRDCARAFADCSTKSPTGCTDRQFTTCPEGGHADKCDGDVRIGCDASRRLSYHDCERMGGTCSGSPGTGADCVYGAVDPECGGTQPALAACNGDKLSACMRGRRIEIGAPTICSG